MLRPWQTLISFSKVPSPHCYPPCLYWPAAAPEFQSREEVLYCFPFLMTSFFRSPSPPPPPPSSPIPSPPHPSFLLSNILCPPLVKQTSRTETGSSPCLKHYLPPGSGNLLPFPNFSASRGQWLPLPLGFPGLCSSHLISPRGLLISSLSAISLCVYHRASLRPASSKQAS